MADFWDQALGILEAVAPTVATAFGGPLAGQAVTFLEQKLGVTPDAGSSMDARKAALAQQIVGMTPEQLIVVKAAELEFQKHIADLGVDLERIASGDRDSARKMQIETRDWTPRILAVLLVIGYFTVLAYMLKYGIPKDTGGSEALLLMIGALGTSVTTIIAFYYGSSAGSASKDATIKAAVSK